MGGKLHRPEDCGCKPRHFGRYYSGTVAWSGRWRFSNEFGSGSGGETVTATIDSAAALSAVPVPTRVTCGGKVSSQGSSQTVSGNGLVDIVTTPDGETPNSGTYLIRVACGSEGSPAKLDHGIAITINRQETVTPDLRVLIGSETYEHPNTDRANNLTGTLTVSWRLTTERREGR
jgi:hypothetical protein